MILYLPLKGLLQNEQQLLQETWLKRCLWINLGMLCMFHLLYSWFWNTVIKLTYVVATPCFAGKKFKLLPPQGEDLPVKGFDPGMDTYTAPPKDTSQISVKVDPKSDRLQLLDPFKKWDGRDITDALILIKVRHLVVNY